MDSFLRLVLLVGFTYGQTQDAELCKIFEPFRVSPDNVKLLFGGAFPLHALGCESVRPDTVQELVAVQWALTHWNQNPSNADYKIAMEAADTCSRNEESVSQTLNFLKTAGHFNPQECLFAEKTRLTGIICPKDVSSARVVGKLLESIAIPTITYSTAGTIGLHSSQNPLKISTAPSLSQYLTAITALLKSLMSDITTLIVSPKYVDGKVEEFVKKYLSEKNIRVVETLDITDPSFRRNVIDQRNSGRIFIALLSKMEILRVFTLEQGNSGRNLWMRVPVDGEEISEAEAKVLLPHPTRGTIMLLQQRPLEITEFKEYFLRTLRNNYRTHPLLSSYIQQIYNCSVEAEDETSCELVDHADMSLKFRQASGVNPAILTAYALSSLGKTLEENSIAEDFLNCGTDSNPENCRSLVKTLMDRVTYRFGEYDPSMLRNFFLQFDTDEQGFYVAGAQLIDGLQVTHARGGQSTVSKVLEYVTGQSPGVFEGNFRWADGSRIQSHCSMYPLQCPTCTNFVTADPTRFSLSIPKAYQLHLMGVFDLHESDCWTSPMGKDRLSLPLAFLHTIWTVKQRFPKLNLLPGVELGGIVVDSCSSDKKLYDAIVKLEEDCLVLPYSNQNITIIPESIIGYASSRESDQLNGVLHSTNKPIVSISSSDRPNLISLTPTDRSQALAIKELLNRNNWNFVSVIYSSDDENLLSGFRAFEEVFAESETCISSSFSTDQLREASAPVVLASRIVILFTTKMEAAELLKNREELLSNDRDERMMFIFVGEAHFWRESDLFKREEPAIWESNALGSISIVPKSPSRPQLFDWIDNLTPEKFPEPWFYRIVEEEFGCALTHEGEREYRNKRCTGKELIAAKRNLFQQSRKAGYFAQGIESLIFAADAAYKKFCPEKSGICGLFLKEGNREIQRHLTSVNRDSRFEIINFRMRAPESLDAIATEEALIGIWSSQEGLKLSDDLIWYDETLAAAEELPKARCDPPMCRCFPQQGFWKEPLAGSTRPTKHFSEGILTKGEGRVIPDRSSQSGIERVKISPSDWKSHIWTYIFLAITSLLLLTAVLVLILVCIKLYYRVVKGNQSLGICLLSGVILLYITAFFFIFEPSDINCRCRFFFHSAAYSICFGVMIAKAVQLRNSESLGYNGFLSFWNYWLLLFFVVGLQIALNIQYLVIRAPTALNHIADFGKNELFLFKECDWSRDEFLFSQFYILILIGATLFLAIMNRSIKRNYKETKWLFYTALLALPMWILWMIAYRFIPHPFQDTVVVMELLICATLILCFMFGPKLYILLSYEPVLIEYPPGFKVSTQSGGEDSATRIDFLGNKEETSFEDRADSPDTATTASLHSPTPLSTGEQSPVFQAVVRKKSRSKRIKAGTGNIRRGSQYLEENERALSDAGSDLSSIRT